MKTGSVGDLEAVSDPLESSLSSLLVSTSYYVESLKLGGRGGGGDNINMNIPDVPKSPVTQYL